MERRIGTGPGGRPAVAVPLVLVVDDDPDIRTICAKALQAAGYRTATASSGDEALAFVAQDELPGLVILDLVMPDTDGFSTIHALRSNPKCRTLPILVLTGLSNNAEAAAERIGATAFCSKPLDLRRLVAKVSRICPLSGPAPRPTGPTPR